jgi:acetyl/propionyl-CoA carboxylase alpha subunit
MSKITLQRPDRTEPSVLDARLEGDAFSVTVDDTVYEGTLVVTGPGEGWLNYAGRILPFYMTQKQDALSIWLDGHTYAFNLLSPDARRAGGAQAGGLQSGDIKAPMPGTVLKVPVKPGDRVAANQPLVIMESMKMEMTLSSPTAATVKDVLCSEGQLVEMGAVLVKLEPESDA